MKKLFFYVLIAFVALTFGLVGCDDGDDGSDGASAYEIAVENGFEGTEEEWLESLQGDPAPVTAEPESCAVCHASVEAAHAATDVAAVGPVTTTIQNNSLILEFDVTVDGMPRPDFVLRRVYVNYVNSANLGDTITPFIRTQLYRDGRDVPGTGVSLSSTIGGTYTVTIADGPGESGDLDDTDRFYDDGVIEDGTYLVQLQTDPDLSSERPVAIASNGTRQLRDLVTEDGCVDCHGSFPAWSEKFRHYAVIGPDCQICHSRETRSTAFISRDELGEFVITDEVFGTNITEYIHGIHNSHNMPGGVYYRTDEPDESATVEDRYSIGYPSDMINCAICHVDDSDSGGTNRVELAVSAPVSYYLCMSCHNNWDGYVDSNGEPIMVGTIGSIHRPLTINNDCMSSSCHGVPGRSEAADFHNTFEDDAYYRGRNVSFENATNVGFQVDNVAILGTDLAVTWSATEGNPPVAVDPCNTDVALGPTFQALRGYLAYAKGDDWVNEFVGSSPGQPDGRTEFFPDEAVNTTCEGNVATTTGFVLDEDALVYASKITLGVGGKPERLFTEDDVNEAIPIRVSSVTYEFDLEGNPVTPRRDAVATAKCLGCHQGTLYEHGGDRVDNEQLCVLCHNPASSDKNNRLDRFQIVNEDGTVNTDATYDGQTDESYDLRTMLHAIHGVNLRQSPWTVYRGRGIYAFAPALVDENDMAIEWPKPEGWPEDNKDDPNSEPIFGSTNGSTINHNWIVVHYPKPISECAACHNDEAFEAVDQTLAVPLTVEAGFDWPDQSDDTVIGPNAAACTACHYDAVTERHATVDFGYKANVTKDEMLEKAAQ